MEPGIESGCAPSLIWDMTLLVMSFIAALAVGSFFIDMICERRSYARISVVTKRLPVIVAPPACIAVFRFMLDCSAVDWVLGHTCSVSYVVWMYLSTIVFTDNGMAKGQLEWKHGME